MTLPQVKQRTGMIIFLGVDVLLFRVKWSMKLKIVKDGRVCPDKPRPLFFFTKKVFFVTLGIQRPSQYSTDYPLSLSTLATQSPVAVNENNHTQRLL